MKIVTLYNDPEIEDPSEHDSQFTIHSFSRKHKSYRSPDDFFPLSIGLRRKLQCGTAFLLSYYEHGASRWSLKGEGPQCRFDTVGVAGILLWEHDPKIIGRTREEREKAARLFLETYTAWCNGEGYGYAVEEEVLLPCGHKEVNTIDSCGGYYGNDVEYMASCVRDVVKGDEVTFRGDARFLAERYDFRGAAPVSEAPANL